MKNLRPAGGWRGFLYLLKRTDTQNVFFVTFPLFVFFCCLFCNLQKRQQNARTCRENGAPANTFAAFCFLHAADDNDDDDDDDDDDHDGDGLDDDDDDALVLALAKAERADRTDQEASSRPASQQHQQASQQANNKPTSQQ